MNTESIGSRITRMVLGRDQAGFREFARGDWVFVIALLSGTALATIFMLFAIISSNAWVAIYSGMIVAMTSMFSLFAGVLLHGLQFLHTRDPLDRCLIVYSSVITGILLGEAAILLNVHYVH